ncbi:C4-dicarboxylate transporter DctA [Bradyrhizobium sp. dw_78]|uniref:C4-dicarboxylate transporter DctA n=1 Tax=Bradyrhizobium sp. dw_78 TaxID=2719793 RepID=UPI001BD2E5DB|nr:C4-dicarboxylate transporter DctA [Bradyrhizobium sp. dw_78]
MSAIPVENAVARKPILGPLWLQVLIGAILGIVFGVVAPQAAAETAFLAEGFVKLIRMLLAPVIFLTVVVGIARMGNLREVGRVGIKAIIYFEVLSTVSLVIGVLAAEIVKPGAGLHVDPHSLNADLVAGYAHSAEQMTLQSFLLNLIPSSITQAFAQNNMLQIIVFAVLFGIVLSQIQQKVQPLLNIFDQLMIALFGVVRVVMYLAPIAAFGGMAFTIGKYGLGSVVALGEFVLCCYAASALFVIVVLGLVARAVGVRLFSLLRYLREELLIVFSTSSSEAVLPQVMEKLEAIGCPRSIVGLVVPAGITFNADGTAIYLSLAALFIAQATGTSLTYTQEIVILLVLMLTSKGSAGVAGAGFVTLAATLATMNTIPLAGIVLLLGVDRFVNPPRALINVIGNSLGTIVVALWENDFERAKAGDIMR